MNSNTNNNGKRNLLQSSQYKPIRIRPYYDPPTFGILPNAQKIYIKKLLSTSILYLEQFLSVVPVEGPLLINRCQRTWYYDEFTYSVCPLSEYTHPIKCQYATIPDAHMAESWYYHETTKQSTLYKPAGSGIDDADVVIYVTYSDQQCVMDGGTIAWASICNLDQYGRPVAGTINFCPNALQANYWKFDVGVTLHELMHILVMSNTLFPYFYDLTTQQMRGESNTIMDEFQSGTRNAYIITPEVAQIAKYHFGCPSLMGAPLENDGSSNLGTIGSHWESKSFQYELMCGTIYSAIMYVSEFTLALLQDSGWYRVDYNYADDFPWGENQGCDFVYGDCTNRVSKTSNFGQFWCESVQDDGCSFDGSTIAECVHLAQGNIPPEFQWYSDSSFGGPSATDYCAFRNPKTNPNYPDFEKLCWDTRGNSIASTTMDYPSSGYGINSRCIEINDGTFQNGYCFQFECINYNIFSKEYGGVRITLSDGAIDGAETMICLRRDSNKYKESNTYGQSVKCPNIDSVCGHSTKPFACYFGNWNDNLNKCVCSIGYHGTDCSVIDDKRFATEATLSQIIPNSVSPQYGTGICIRNSIFSIINGYYELSTEYEGLPSYQHNIEIKHKSDARNFPNPNSNLYLYFIRYFSQWSIGVNKGDSSVYAYCLQSVSPTQVIDIQYCRQWAVWDNTQSQWIYDTGLSVYHCTPTYAPSSNPTTDPTLEPTFMPTTNPTMEPTFNPTLEPTTEPTKNPTTDPTADPTKDPTSDPTSDPTFEPTSEPTTEPTSMPTTDPTGDPTFDPTNEPTTDPSKDPTIDPTVDPTVDPTSDPTFDPTSEPTMDPSNDPTIDPTLDPTGDPTFDPTFDPIGDPTMDPSEHPSTDPTFDPTDIPTPTKAPIYSIMVETDFPTYNPTAFPTEDPMDEEDDDLELSESEASSNFDAWFIGVFVFLGTCIFINIGFVCLWFYLIKPRCIDRMQLRTSINELNPQDGLLGADTTDPTITDL